MIKPHVSSWQQRNKIQGSSRFYIMTYYQWQFHFDILIFKHIMKPLMTYVFPYLELESFFYFLEIWGGGGRDSHKTIIIQSFFCLKMWHFHSCSYILSDHTSNPSSNTRRRFKKSYFKILFISIGSS